jgi:hypothetical protein
VVLPDLKMPIAIASDSSKLVGSIRPSCGVRFEQDSDDTLICMTGAPPAHLQTAIVDINDAIRGYRTKEAGGHRHILVQPVSEGDAADGADGVVTVRFNKGSGRGDARPLFKSNGKGLPASMRDFTVSSHEQRIVDHFQQSMSTLQGLGCNLRMRANLGLLKVQQPRDAPSEYRLEQFVAKSDGFTRSARTRLDTRYSRLTIRLAHGRAVANSNLLRSLGSGEQGDKILDLLAAKYSAAAGADGPAKLECSHKIYLVTPDRQIEATITNAADQGGVTRQRLATVEMFRRNWNRLDITSACPHMYYPASAPRPMPCI